MLAELLDTIRNQAFLALERQDLRLLEIKLNHLQLQLFAAIAQSDAAALQSIRQTLFEISAQPAAASLHRDFHPAAVRMDFLLDAARMAESMAAGDQHASAKGKKTKPRRATNQALLPQEDAVHRDRAKRAVRYRVAVKRRKRSGKSVHVA